MNSEIQRGRSRGRRAAPSAGNAESSSLLDDAAEEELDLQVLHNVNRSRFQDFCDRSLSVGTKRQYGYKILALKNFLRSEFPSRIEGDNIILPLGEDVITSFFGHIAFRRPQTGESINIEDTTSQTLSHPYIATYRSAIVSEYTRQNLRFPDVEEKILQKFRSRGGEFVSKACVCESQKSIYLPHSITSYISVYPEANFKFASGRNSQRSVH